MPRIEEWMMVKMKFDVPRAKSLCQELGGPDYAGPDGEAKVADFVAGQFEKTGLSVERREVSGSRVPQRVAMWFGWLGCGAVLTAVYGLILTNNVASTIVALALAILGFYWVDAVVGGRIRLGRGRPPLETAPVVIASLPTAREGLVRVVFQAILGGLKPDVFQVSRGSYRIYAAVKLGIVFVLLSLLALRAWVYLLPDRVRGLTSAVNLARTLYPGLLALMWSGIVCLLIREHRQARRSAGRSLIERRGVAVLLEMARTWPRIPARPIEPMFVAAGGQGLDDAGCREVVRSLRSDGSGKPTLLVVFLAPGAGEKLGLLVFESLLDDLDELVEKATQGLWIPILDDPALAVIPPWPVQSYHPAVVVTGSARRLLDDGQVDPQALHRAAQLATEIALRWAKTQKPAESAG